MASESFRVAVLGDAFVDVVAAEVDALPAAWGAAVTARSVSLHVGGSSSNTARSLSRLGRALAGAPPPALPQPTSLDARDAACADAAEAPCVLRRRRTTAVRLRVAYGSLVCEDAMGRFFARGLTEDGVDTALLRQLPATVRGRLCRGVGTRGRSYARCLGVVCVNPRKFQGCASPRLVGLRVVQAALSTPICIVLSRGGAASNRSFVNSLGTNNLVRGLDLLHKGNERETDRDTQRHRDNEIDKARRQDAVVKSRRLGAQVSADAWLEPQPCDTLAQSHWLHIGGCVRALLSLGQAALFHAVRALWFQVHVLHRYLNCRRLHGASLITLLQRLRDRGDNARPLISLDPQTRQEVPLSLVFAGSLLVGSCIGLRLMCCLCVHRAAAGWVKATTYCRSFLCWMCFCPTKTSCVALPRRHAPCAVRFPCSRTSALTWRWRPRPPP